MKNIHMSFMILLRSWHRVLCCIHKTHIFHFNILWSHSCSLSLSTSMFKLEMSCDDCFVLLRKPKCRQFMWSPYSHSSLSRSLSLSIYLFLASFPNKSVRKIAFVNNRDKDNWSLWWKFMLCWREYTRTNVNPLHLVLRCDKFSLLHCRLFLFSLHTK